MVYCSSRENIRERKERKITFLFFLKSSTIFDKLDWLFFNLSVKLLLYYSRAVYSKERLKFG